MRAHLSKADIANLLKSPTPEGRSELASKIVAQVEEPALSPEERNQAEAILRLLVRDAAERVRKALSQHAKASGQIPKDVALALAEDIDEISVPVLETSPLLDDNDLIRLVRSGSPEKQGAIARRETVSEALADVIVDHGAVSAVADLIKNPGASLNEKTLAKVADKHGGKTEVNTPLATRPNLPVTVAERLIHLVSDHMRDLLVKRYSVNSGVADQISEWSLERAIVQLAKEDRRRDSLEKLVVQLHGKGRLTPSLVTRALCAGDMPLFELAMTRLSKLDGANARLLIHDRGPHGLRALFEKAGLPDALFPVVSLAVKVYHELEYDGREGDRTRFRDRMIERILTQYDGMDSDDVDYLVDRLGAQSEAKAALPA